MSSQNSLLILGAGQYGVMAKEIAEAMGVFNCITPAILVHPAAYVSPSAQLQKGCCIEPNATVQAGAVIAAASFVSSGAVIRHNAFIGEFCHVDCNAVVESLAIVPAGTKIPCNSVFCQEEGLGYEGLNF